MIEVAGLNFSYRCGREILYDVSFSAPAGSCMAILGNNGAGKSTLLKCFAHLLRPQSGQVLVDARMIGGSPADHGGQYRRYHHQGQGQKAHPPVFHGIPLPSCPSGLSC